MVTMVKWIAVIAGLATLAFIFPPVQQIYKAAGNSTTGMFYPVSGDTTPDAFIMFLPILIPVIFFVALIIFVVKSGQSQGEG